MVKCLKCGRELKDRASVERGIGPICLQKIRREEDLREKTQKNIEDFAEGLHNKKLPGPVISDVGMSGEIRPEPEIRSRDLPWGLVSERIEHGPITPSDGGVL